jgi:mono/diheme cytochrome c family protein
VRNTSLLVILMGIIASVVVAQNPASSGARAISGADLYSQHCASCHGKDAKGDGPVASALKTRPPDLTMLAKKNRGRFPDGNIYQVIKWGGGISGHGSKEMPVWGKTFMANGKSSEQEVDLRIRALIRYLGTLQEK